MNALEIADGVNIYAKRKGPAENRLTPRTQATFSEQTPELMDETATGDWLDFLCAQGLAYLRAHVKYLEQAWFEVVRIEEEVRQRVRLTLVRKRPGRRSPQTGDTILFQEKKVMSPTRGPAGVPVPSSRSFVLCPGFAMIR